MENSANFTPESMHELFKKFAKLDLPKDSYAIYGSGPLAIRGLKGLNDVDVVVTDEFFTTLVERYGKEASGKIEMENGDIEIFSAHSSLLEDPYGLIERAEDINGLKFALLEDIVQWKKKRGKEKDAVDIKTVEEYLNRSSDNEL
ncbi:MAG: hypothetical protein ACQESA_03330 [Patescibacteria group bacterium]